MSSPPGVIITIYLFSCILFSIMVRENLPEDKKHWALVISPIIMIGLGMLMMYFMPETQLPY